MYEKYFKGTKVLTAFVVRQQRLRIIIWFISLVGINLIVASAYQSIYTDEASRQAAYMTMDNPAMIAMLGPGYEIDTFIESVGPLFANEMLLFTAIAVAIMSILLVGQATRGDEEDGRTEMIRALSVGRLSHTSAVMIVNVLTNVLLAILIGFGIASLGIVGMDVKSSLLYGAILGVTGLTFAAFTAVFAQLTENARTTMILSFFILISAYLLRAIGDVGNEFISFVSPLGWTVRTEVFVENNWGPVVLLCISALILGMVALYLHAIRDVGAGFIAPRKGKANASPLLKNPIGFNLWLQKTNIIAWAIGIFALCASFGAILGDLETYYADMEILESYIEMNSAYTLTEQFVTLIIAIMSLFSVVPVVMTILRLKGEENKNLTENIYSRAVSRTQVLGSYLLLAVVVSFIMQSMIAFGLWSASGTVMEEALTFQTTLTSAYVYLPAIWVMTGFIILLVSAIPRFSGVFWLYFTYCFIVIYLGELLNFPEWMHHLSIFHYIPQIPVDDVNVMAIITLTLIGIGLTVVGFVSYNRRDLMG